MLIGSCGAQQIFTSRWRSRCISGSFANHDIVSFNTRAASASFGSAMR